MRAFTVATGAYAPLAKVTAACFEWATGLAPVVVTDATDPYAAKLASYPDEHRVFFDADLLFRRKVDLPKVAPEVFAAVRLAMPDRSLAKIRARHELPATMVSTGLFIASGHHRAAMELALELMGRNEPASSAHEETWLNVALRETGAQMTLLHGALNQQQITNARGATLHFCCEPGPQRKLAAVMRSLRLHAPTELCEFLRARRVCDVRDALRATRVRRLVPTAALRGK